MTKIKLIQVKGSSYYCSGRLSVGVYIAGGKAVIFDSGIDKANAKAIEKALVDNDCIPVAIINTHSHADHCGGNQYFQQKYKNIRVYATKYERHFIEDPVNEPRCFCAGASPLHELRNRYLEAKPSTVTHVIHPYEDQAIYIDEMKFSIITLPGHTPGMIGIITPDNVLYSGDAIFGNDTYDKHGILFYTDIEATIKTFDKITSLNVKDTVLYHGEHCTDVQAKAIAHKLKIEQTADKVANLIKRSASTTIDDLTATVIKDFGIPENVMQYTLTRTCVNAYISYLQKMGRVSLDMHHGALIVSCTQPAELERNSSASRLTM